MPRTINIGGAKAHLLHLVARAEAGEDVIIARSHALSACDAACLETALRRGDSLAVPDRALASAAAAEEVSVIH